jgi:chemotaxis protein MotB
MTAEEAQSLQEAIDEIEEQKMKLSEMMAEKIEEALAESMMSDKVDVEFTSDYVLLTLNGAFLFDSGKADIKSDAIPVLNKIGVLLTKYADSDIEIEGHTDSVPLNGGRYENNDVLSSYRALAVFNYLKENAAIDPSVMKHSGRGEYVPIADNSTPEGRAKNRRVEIKIFNSLSGY